MDTFDNVAGQITKYDTNSTFIDKQNSSLTSMTYSQSREMGRYY